MFFQAYDASDAVVISDVYYSPGGGIIEKGELWHADKANLIKEGSTRAPISPPNTSAQQVKIVKQERSIYGKL